MEKDLHFMVVRGIVARRFGLRMVGKDGKWPVRDFVLDMGNGRQKRLMQAVRGALESLEGIGDGVEVEVEFVMKGREIAGVDGRNGYFNLDEVHKIRLV